MGPNKTGKGTKFFENPFVMVKVRCFEVSKCGGSC